jgi:hypothetical protein
MISNLLLAAVCAFVAGWMLRNLVTIAAWCEEHIALEHLVILLGCGLFLLAAFTDVLYERIKGLF